MTIGARFFLAVSLLALIGCAGSGKGGDEPIDRGPAPTYAQVASRYNARVDKLDRVRSAMSIFIKTVDTQGKDVDEQADGHLQLVRPSRVALRIDKVGKTIFYLGGDESRFWWLDLTRDPKAALVGTHANVTRERGARVGLPVHPLDLMLMLGVMPLPAEGDSPRWADAGKSLRLDLAGRWGATRLILDPVTLEPTQIELMDAEGHPAVTATLTDYERVAIDGDAMSIARLATKIEILMPASQTRVRLRLYDPENPGDRIRDRAFDLESLLDAYDVQRLLDLDVEPSP